MANCEHQIRRQSCSICSPGQVYAAYRRNAAKRKLTFTLSQEQFERLVGKACVYCGAIAMGIDRRENARGYIFSDNPVLNNCWPCCGQCNRAKGTMTHEAFVQLCLSVTQHQEKEKLRKQKLAVPPQVAA